MQIEGAGSTPQDELGLEWNDERSPYWPSYCRYPTRCLRSHVKYYT